MESLSPYKKEMALGILKQIEEAIVRLQERTANIHSVDDFLLSPVGMEKLDAACMLLIAIGESLKGFDKVTEKRILTTYPQIPWSSVMGVRDIIAHHYFNVDAEEIFNIIHGELSSLLDAIRHFVRELSSSVITVGLNEVYKDKLSTEEWRQKCREIKERDHYKCQNCDNSVLIELAGIDDLERYLIEKEKDNFKIIKEIFENRDSIVNGEGKFNVGESPIISLLEIKCRFLDGYDLYQYEMENASCPWEHSHRLILSEEIDYSERNKIQLYNIINTKINKESIITLQFNNSGNTNDRYLLHSYSQSRDRVGVLSYNQYSVIFPISALNFRLSLEVHHKVYKKENGRMIEPWEYDNSDLETLCHCCHLKKHKLPIPVIDK